MKEDASRKKQCGQSRQLFLLEKVFWNGGHRCESRINTQPWSRRLVFLSNADWFWNPSMYLAFTYTSDYWDSMMYDPWGISLGQWDCFCFCLYLFIGSLTLTHHMPMCTILDGIHFTPLKFVFSCWHLSHIQFETPTLECQDFIREYSCPPNDDIRDYALEESSGACLVDGEISIPGFPGTVGFPTGMPTSVSPTELSTTG